MQMELSLCDAEKALVLLILATFHNVGQVGYVYFFACCTLATNSNSILKATKCPKCRQSVYNSSNVRYVRQNVKYEFSQS